MRLAQGRTRPTGWNDGELGMDSSKISSPGPPSGLPGAAPANFVVRPEMSCRIERDSSVICGDPAKELSTCLPASTPAGSLNQFRTDLEIPIDSLSSTNALDYRSFEPQQLRWQLEGAGGSPRCDNLSVGCSAVAGLRCLLDEPSGSCQLNRRIEKRTLAGLMALFALIASACVSSDQSKSTVRSGAPWARDLNEPPPSREPTSDSASKLKADLNAAREKAGR
jgi:hypothetical protein